MKSSAGQNCDAVAADLPDKILLHVLCGALFVVGYHRQSPKAKEAVRLAFVPTLHE